MKKITAFFMAVLPFFVTILLFAAGFIVKEVGPTIHVEKVVIEDLESLDVKKTSDTDPATAKVSAHVLPVTATVQDIVWKSDNPEIADVDQSGNVTCKNWGTTKIYACSKENQNIQTSLDVEVYDNVIHKLIVSDEEIDALNNFGLNQRRQIEYTAIPNTRITDPTVIFALHNSEDKQYLDIAADGTIMPKKTTPTPVQVDMWPKTDAKRVTSVKVNVILGVEQMDVKENTTAISTSSQYDVYDQLVTAPTEKSNLARNAFVYSSSNEEIARIDNQGVATFIQPGEVQFTAAYKRDASLKATKSVISTCSFISDVHFNADKYEVELEWDSGLNNWKSKRIENMQCSTFPQSDDWEDLLEVSSSDPSILTVNKVLQPGSQTRYEYEFVAKKPGTVYVLCEAATGASFTSFVRDAALVTIKGKSGQTQDYGLVKNAQVTADEDSTIYYLMKNINLPSSFKYSHNISFSIDAQSSSTTNVEIDDENRLHITSFDNETDEVTVGINLLVDNELGGRFTVKFKPGKLLEPKVTNEGLELEAGKRYKFADGSSPVFGPLHPYSSKFYHYRDTDGVVVFTPKYGMNIANFKVSHGLLEKEYTKLVATEKPLYITSDLPLFYTTEQVEFDYGYTANIQIVPSTAMKSDGVAYTIKNQYTFADEDAGKVEDDYVTFNKANLLFVDTSIEDMPEIVTHSIVKSTFGALSKFNVYDKETPTAADQPIASNATIQFSPTDEKKFYVNDLTESQAQQIKLEPVSDISSICTLNKEIKSVGTLFNPKYQVIFTIKANNDAFGEEYLAFKTKAYAVYVKAKVDTEVSGFTITHNREQLIPYEETYKNITTSYIDDPIFRYTSNPIAAKADFSVELNGTVLSKGEAVTDIVNTKEKTIDFTKAAAANKLKLGENNLVFKWQITRGGAAQQQTQTYKINYTQDFSNFHVEILNSEITEEGGKKVRNLYLNYNETQKTFYLKANGLIDSELFSQPGFSVEFETGQSTHQVTFLQNSLTIKGIPAPSTQNPIYTNKMTLKFNGTALGDPYVITRDVVSKVKFPDHDNTDKSDKKGMQRVHVYGNKSFDDKNEIIDGYKLPIELYDFNNEKIEDATIKEKAFKTLRYWVDNDKATFEYKDGYIHIQFRPENLYTPEEIHNNAFDTKTGKNITFHAENKTKTSTASYTFVAVEGYNVTNQEQLKKIWKQAGIKSIAVLQNDFGTSTGAKFDDKAFGNDQRFDFGGIYGNGHTMLFENIFSCQPSGAKCFYSEFASNVTFAMFKDEELKWGETDDQTIGGVFSTNETSLNMDKHMYAYVNFKNVNTGFCLEDATKDKYFKNCLFSNGLHGVITTNGNGCKSATYFEDCSFFNAGCFALWPGVNSMDATCKVYFKGKIPVYNFHHNEMFKHFWGTDVSGPIWPIARTFAYNANMLQTGPDGREYINSFMISWLNPNIFFWDATKGEYVKAQKGTEATGEYLGKYGDFDFSRIKPGLEAALWGTVNPSVIGGAPNYMDEFNADGSINYAFFDKLVSGLSRTPTWF